MSEKVEYSRIGAVEAEAMERVVNDLLLSDEPVAAISRVLSQQDNPSATAFERYAAKLLFNAEGQRIVSASKANPLKVIAPDNGQLAQLVPVGRFPNYLQPTLLSVECAVNRLVCIADAIADGIAYGEDPHKELRRSISILGGGYLATNAGWRSTRVQLPPVDANANITTSFYNEVDWRSTDCVASNARAVFQRSMRPNGYRSIYDINGGNQTDWDVRTRLAQIMRAMELPHRYSFRFDYDDASKTVEAVFTCPPNKFLPAVLNAPYANLPDSRQLAYESYLLRLACLFAAACFGSGRGIQEVVVTGYNASWKKALVCAHFTRDQYVRSVLTSVDSNEIANPAYRFKPVKVARLIDATHLDWMGNPAHPDTDEISLPRVSVSSLHQEPGLDERELSKEAKELFRCQRVCDVDTLRYFGGSSDAVDHARVDSEDSTLAAILRLESLVEELEREHAPSHGAVRLLYAANPMSRLAVSLLHDEMSIADQAEAFLHDESILQGEMQNTEASSQGAASSQDETCPRDDFSRFQSVDGKQLFTRAPDALFHARFGLSDLYQRIGDLNGAAAQADRCIALAPTTASAYYRKADVLTEQGFLPQAANVLMDGLRYSTTSYDSALLYYYLGMLMWNTDKQEEATLIHVYNSSLQGEYAQRSKHVVEGLRKSEDVPPSVHLSPFSAAHLLRSLGIPVAPVNMRLQVARATISLANAGSPKAAAPYAHELERSCNNDEIVIATCRSIQFGTALL